MRPLLSLGDVPKRPPVPLIHRPLTASEVDAFARMVRQCFNQAKSVSVDAMPPEEGELSRRARYYVSVEFEPGTDLHVVSNLGRDLGCSMGNTVLHPGSWAGLRYCGVEPSALRRFPREEDDQ